MGGELGKGFVIAGATAGIGVLLEGARGGSFQPGISFRKAAGMGGGGAVLIGVGAVLPGGVYPVLTAGGGTGTIGPAFIFDG